MISTILDLFSQQHLIIMALLFCILWLSIISRRQSIAREIATASKIDALFPKGRYLRFKAERNKLIVAKHIARMRYELYHVRRV